MSESVMLPGPWLARTGQECSQMLRMGSKWSRPGGLMGGLTFQYTVVPGAALGSDTLCQRGLSSGVRAAPAPTASGGHTTAD